MQPRINVTADGLFELLDKYGKPMFKSSRPGAIKGAYLKAVELSFDDLIEDLLKGVDPFKHSGPQKTQKHNLAHFLTAEFTERQIMSLDDPRWQMAELAHLVLDKKLQSVNTATRDRISSLYKHLYAFDQGLKPYGQKSRVIGKYQKWFEKHFYVQAIAQTVEKYKQTR